MIRRSVEAAVRASLQNSPAVGLVGPRQVGKTTLARSLGEEFPGAAYLDLERPSDLAKLHDPESYLTRHVGSLVILDEAQRMPELFPVLRALIDEDPRNGRFLVLGSASPDLARQASESLAGRILNHELTGFVLAEIGSDREALDRSWLRGGFPRSYLAGTDDASLQWREGFVQTFLERDIPGLGIRVPAPALRRFWGMLAHAHGQTWNASTLAGALGITGKTARHYLDILSETFVVRQLQPYHSNLGKRLVKSPKVYLRDSGLLHALLHIESLEDLLGHPILGASWEGWVVEQIIGALPRGCESFYYRSHAGAEVDLVVERDKEAHVQRSRRRLGVAKRQLGECAQMPSGTRPPRTQR